MLGEATCTEADLWKQVPVQHIPYVHAYLYKTPRDLAALKSWHGWKLAADEILSAAGGVLPWRNLQDAMVARFEAMTSKLRLRWEKGVLADCALASLPKNYLDKKSNEVSLPNMRRRPRQRRRKSGER